MTVAYADFTAAFPEFSDATKYPQAQFNFWEKQAYIQLNERLFRASMDLAVMLFIAHNMVLSARSAAAAATGGVVGEAGGIATSKAVDKVSVSYDVNLTATEGAGYWNATSYGQRLYTMMRSVSAGPFYSPGFDRSRLPVRWSGR